MKRVDRKGQENEHKCTQTLALHAGSFLLLYTGAKFGTHVLLVSGSQFMKSKNIIHLCSIHRQIIFFSVMINC